MSALVFLYPRDGTKYPMPIIFTISPLRAHPEIDLSVPIATDIAKQQLGGEILGHLIGLVEVRVPVEGQEARIVWDAVHPEGVVKEAPREPAARVAG